MSVIPSGNKGLRARNRTDTVMVGLKSEQPSAERHYLTPGVGADPSGDAMGQSKGNLTDWPPLTPHSAVSSLRTLTECQIIMSADRILWRPVIEQLHNCLSLVNRVMLASKTYMTPGNRVPGNQSVISPRRDQSPGKSGSHLAMTRPVSH